MAIDYKWTIVQMNAHIQADGQDNVIYTVHWNYSGSEEVGGKTYTSGRVGAENFNYEAGESFIPYENTEAFEAIVIGWLEGALDMDAIKAGIDADIQSQVTPVNEDLYFTWQQS